MMFGKHAEANSQGNTESPVQGELEYWNKKIGNTTHLLQLPIDRPRSARATDSIKTSWSELPQDLSRRINELADKLTTNAASVLLAIFKTLLHRYTHHDDLLLLLVNNDASSRVDEFGNLAQSTSRKMILRTNVSGDPIFSEFAKEVHRNFMEAEQHQCMLFDALMTGLIGGGVDGHSFPQIVFQVGTIENYQDNILENSGIADIHLAVMDTPGGLSTQWTYNPGLFDEETITRISGHYTNLLSAVVSDPDKKISELNFLSSQETNKILVEWNDTTVEYPSHKCIHELFEEQVTNTPDATAVELYAMGTTPDLLIKRSFTYQELNAKANQLAHRLMELGVGPDVLVGVCMSRSPELVVALIGILKAGGAYVPMDPSYPKDRLGFMLKDSAVSILITEQQLSQDFLETQLEVISLDSQWDTIGGYPNVNVPAKIEPANLAYVIYTSGSTGVPKGTLITHHGVVNYLSWCIKHYAVATGSGAPVNSSIAFDATVTSFFAPLLTGTRVVLLPEKQEIEALAEVLMSRQHFSLVKITPAHLEILRHMFAESELDGQTNCFVIGGEALPAAVVELWQRHASSTRLINEYGPTETVVGCCTYEIGSSEYAGDDVPIGKPIANTQIYILDQHMQPVPIGVSGEIYIGGAGVARGYLNRPDLTEERFVQNPFSEDPQARLYKSGDLARYLSDGNIIFQGRIDHQVKIRGYRIELGEIESALAKHSLLQQAAVLARADNGADKRLVAYVVAKNPSPSVRDLRSYLAEKLPEYMTPAVFVFMETMPLTTNGKIDRAALPAPEQVQAGSDGAFVGPRTDTQLALKKIFEKCLSRSPIGITDDFFEMGGNSVQAAIAFSQIRKVLGKPLPLSVLIAAPTIEKLSAHLDGQTEKTTYTCLVPIQANGNKPPLFCIHGGLGNVLFYRHLSNHLGTDQPVYGLQAKGLAGTDRPSGSIEEMAADYISEIRSIQPEGPYYLAGYCFGAIVAFEIAGQLVQAGQKIAFLGSFNGIAPAQQYSVGLSSFLRMYPTDSPKNIALYPLRISKFLLRRYSLIAYYAIVFKARGIAYDFYSENGRVMPDSLRRQYVVDALDKALKKYQPKTYPGQLVIFRSPKLFKTPHLRWKKFIAGGMKIHDMPGDYKNRRFMMYEPYVGALAEELKKYLDQR